jgi:hypothetical protein
MLNVFDRVPGIALVPSPIKSLIGDAQLGNEIIGELLRLGFAAFFAPKMEEGGFIRPHERSGAPFDA